MVLVISMVDRHIRVVPVMAECIMETGMVVVSGKTAQITEPGPMMGQGNSMVARGVVAERTGSPVLAVRDAATDPKFTFFFGQFHRSQI